MKQGSLVGKLSGWLDLSSAAMAFSVSLRATFQAAAAFSLPHRAEALCFVRAAFQAGADDHCALVPKLRLRHALGREALLPRRVSAGRFRKMSLATNAPLEMKLSQTQGNLGATRVQPHPGTPPPGKRSFPPKCVTKPELRYEGSSGFVTRGKGLRIVHGGNLTASSTLSSPQPPTGLGRRAFSQGSLRRQPWANLQNTVGVPDQKTCRRIAQTRDTGLKPASAG
jgi:hypothetical protein